MITPELFDTTEVLLKSLLREALERKRKGIIGHGVEQVQFAIKAVQRWRKCRSGHKAGE